LTPSLHAGNILSHFFKMPLYLTLYHLHGLQVPIGLLEQSASYRQKPPPIMLVQGDPFPGGAVHQPYRAAKQALTLKLKLGLGLSVTTPDLL
jgi:hypothetical protein